MDLSALPGFELMTPTQRADLIRASEPVTIPAGKELITRGDGGGAIYVLTEGRMRVHVGDQELAELEAPCIVGELELLTGECHAASVTALEVCQGYSIGHEQLRERLRDGDTAALELVYAVARALATRLAAMDERIIEVLAAGGNHVADLATLKKKLFGEWS